MNRRSKLTSRTTARTACALQPLKQSSSILLIRGLLVLALSSILSAATNPDWSRPFPAHRIIGNVFYVGTYDLACFLITTPQGHILINTGLEDSVPMIRKSVESLAFKVEDIKILLTTQAHNDHVAGMAELKKLTGARFLATKGDTQVLEDGGKSDFLFGGDKLLFAPVKVDGTVEQGAKIKIGQTALTAHLHPGHTKGSVSYSLDVVENGKTYRVLIANMGTMNPGTVLIGNKKYPGISDDLARTFADQKKLTCDIFLSSHASQYQLHDKWKPGQAYSPDSFVDPAGYRAAVERTEKVYLDQLAAEKAGR